ncbi:uncharacterized protein Dwil_GK27718 [Drosophila willistoni]|uniref:uncharacterized protein LOC26529720 n=1 Tax=Drosophila willistoni TaxID=7260 RepID=UPI000732AE7D|nr:uncharacterized protein LOC26529720 [Drosophila willistoni]KRF97971.1 uncharacterized protein Dwil_GK27718 [Drosophila willistoni]
MDKSEDLELLDPKDYSIDEISAQFESYKKRRLLEQLEVTNRLNNNFALNGELDDLRASIDNLRLGLQKLQNDQRRFELDDLNAITEVPFAAREESKEEQANNLEDSLVIRCGSRQCIYDGCNRRVDSQLLLLHYITDHSDASGEPMNVEGCHAISPGQRITFTFQPKHLHIRDNRVLGILSYNGGGSGDGGQEIQLPIVVLICKVAASVALNNKSLVESLKARANMMDQVYIIWLITPQNKLKLNASLSLCGRNPALTMTKAVSVHWLNHCEELSHYMPVDKEHWRLPFNEMRHISNNFRDELNLAISLTES